MSWLAPVAFELAGAPEVLACCLGLPAGEEQHAAYVTDEVLEHVRGSALTFGDECPAL